MSTIPSVEAVLKNFRQLNRVPRPSHYEDRCAIYLVRLAEKLGLEVKRDARNNVLICKPATPGYEDAEPIVILNHMDMVCVAADGVKYDPQHDSIKTVVEDGWMHAQGTSLGADNGIGLSMALAILQDDTIVHGPLEVLITTNEEDGMTGAQALDPDWVKGRTVINLDSEDYDSITVAAAGACIQDAGMRSRRLKTPLNSVFMDISISGGLGGHSGVDINKGRANVILLLAQVLTLMNKKQPHWYCHSIQGGTAAASIPSQAKACLVMPEDVAKKLKSVVTSAFNKAVKPYAKTEPGLRLSVTKGKPVDDVIAPEDTIDFLDTLLALPQGPLKMREGEFAGVVQTSSNLGMVVQNRAFFEAFIHSRSFSDAQLDGLTARIAHQFQQQDAAIKTLMTAPSWETDVHSPLMETVEQVFQDVLGIQPRKVPMHFVLEAGYLVAKYPGMQIVSIGPRILNPHSPMERVEMKTVEDIWAVTITLLERLASQKKS